MPVGQGPPYFSALTMTVGRGPSYFSQYRVGLGPPTAIDAVGLGPPTRTLSGNGAMHADWYFDFISPFSYLQLERLGTLRARLEITPVPIVFGAILKHHGQLG